MRDITLTFRHNKQLYTLRVCSKVTLLQGDSAKGKTFLVNNITDVRKPWYVPGVVKYDHRLPHDRALASIQSEDIVFIDEDAIVAIRAVPGALRELFNKNVQLVIVTRDDLTEISYSYKDIYNLVTFGNRTFASRLYADYDVLPDTHTYVCEDAKAGFQYFSDRLQDVRSMNGNKNCLKWNSNVTLILDGSAIGNYMRELYDKHASMYLPESFEYLLIRYYTSLNRETLIHAMPTTFITLEKFCTYLCEVVKVLAFSYHKDRLPYRVYFAKLDQSFPQTSRYAESVEESTDSLHEILYKCGCSNCYRLFDSNENLTARDIIARLRDIKEL